MGFTRSSFLMLELFLFFQYLSGQVWAVPLVATSGTDVLVVDPTLISTTFTTFTFIPSTTTVLTSSATSVTSYESFSTSSTTEDGSSIISSTTVMTTSVDISTSINSATVVVTSTVDLSTTTASVTSSVTTVALTTDVTSTDSSTTVISTIESSTSSSSIADATTSGLSTTDSSSTVSTTTAASSIGSAAITSSTSPVSSTSAMSTSSITSGTSRTDTGGSVSVTVTSTTNLVAATSTSDNTNQSTSTAAIVTTSVSISAITPITSGTSTAANAPSSIGSITQPTLSSTNSLSSSSPSGTSSSTSVTAATAGSTSSTPGTGITTSSSTILTISFTLSSSTMSTSVSVAATTTTSLTTSSRTAFSSSTGSSGSTSTSELSTSALIVIISSTTLSTIASRTTTTAPINSSASTFLPPQFTRGRFRIESTVGSFGEDDLVPGSSRRNLVTDSQSEFTVDGSNYLLSVESGNIAYTYSNDSQVFTNLRSTAATKDRRQVTTLFPLTCSVATSGVLTCDGINGNTSYTDGVFLYIGHSVPAGFAPLTLLAVFDIISNTTTSTTAGISIASPTGAIATTSVSYPRPYWSSWSNWGAVPVSSAVPIPLTTVVVLPGPYGPKTQIVTITSIHCGCTETPVPTSIIMTTLVTECPEAWGYSGPVTVTVPAQETQSLWAAITIGSSGSPSSGTTASPAGPGPGSNTASSSNLPKYGSKTGANMGPRPTSASGSNWTNNSAGINSLLSSSMSTQRAGSTLSVITTSPIAQPTPTSTHDASFSPSTTINVVSIGSSTATIPGSSGVSYKGAAKPLSISVNAGRCVYLFTALAMLFA